MTTWKEIKVMILGEFGSGLDTKKKRKKLLTFYRKNVSLELSDDSPTEIYLYEKTWSTQNVKQEIHP
jgi:hypothetical protein